MSQNLKLSIYVPLSPLLSSEVFFIDYNSDKDIELIKDQVKKAKMVGLFDGTVNDYR